MARKTREQLRTVHEAALLAMEGERRAEYFPRLMQALERACKFDYCLAVANGMFVLMDRRKDHEFSPEYTPAGWDELMELEWQLDVRQSEREEQERRALARARALAKLTDEERELLDL